MNKQNMKLARERDGKRTDMDSVRKMDMKRLDLESLSEEDFDIILSEQMYDNVTDDIVKKVKPWKKAMNYILVGLVLEAFTIHVWYWDYIVQFLKLLLMLFGFRKFRKENGWFQVCLGITVVRMLYFCAKIITQTTIHLQGWEAHNISIRVGVGLELLLLVCFWRALAAVQRKAGLQFKRSGAFMLILWEMAGLLLAMVSYIDWVIFGAMVLAFLFVILNIRKISKELDEVGYVIKSPSVRISDWIMELGITIVLLGILAIGIFCGYTYGGSYHMEWEVLSDKVCGDMEEAGDTKKTEDAEYVKAVQEVKAHLVDLGFPEKVLNDLTDEEIMECKEASYIVVMEDEDSLKMPEGQGKIYFTDVFVKIPEKEQWNIFFHFRWDTNLKFYGTEALQIWPLHDNSEAYGFVDMATGHVLYDKDGETFVSPYQSLEYKAPSSNVQQGLFCNNDTGYIAAFSFPKEGKNQRGYIAYSSSVLKENYSSVVIANYYHQKSWKQYPAEKAIDKLLGGAVFGNDCFHVIQDPLNLDLDVEEIEENN